MFQYQTVMWECSCAVWDESTGVTSEIPPMPRDFRILVRWTISNMRKKPVITPWEIRTHERHRMPSLAAYPMDTYLQMVSEYNGRNLTYLKDRMRAFAGVTTQMETNFPGGFIWGLPVANFEAALLWYNYDMGRVRRSDECQDSTRFPSWSWVGWEGHIAASHWKNRGVHIVGNTEPKYRNGLFGYNTVQLLIIPSCEWHYVTSDGILPVVSDFRLECQEGLGQVREKLQNTLEQNTTSVFLKTRTKVVKCILSAYKGALLKSINIVLSNERNGSPDTDWSGSVSDSNDNYMFTIGYVYLPWEPEENIKGQECELMLLSKSEIQPSSPCIIDEIQPSSTCIIDEWDDLRSVPQAILGDAWHSLRTESVYDVLWITRRDGIAYREALGVVSVEAFDSLPGEMMDIVLG